MTESLARLSVALADRYRIERELGRGGMATVYLAEDLKHRRKVAIKVLRPELSAILGSDRFLKEIELTANLQHPNILPLFDSGVVESRDGRAGRDADQSGPSTPSTLSTPSTFLYYVMPFVEGESLRDRLNRDRHLPVGDAVRIASEVAGALDYAHRRGVIHRDIKPENILLYDGRALVADFGIALAASNAGGTRMTETGMSLGTPQYMSPEQAMGEREVTGRADIYALGATTYEMLSGDPPFTGATAQAVVAKVLTTDPVPIRPARRTVPPHVEAAVFTALEKLPADRFATASEFAQALGGTGSRHAARPARLARPARPLLWPSLALIPVAAASFWLGSRSSTAPPMPALGAMTPVTWDPGLEVQPAVAPDGRTVAYAAGAIPTRLRIFVRPVSGGRPVPLTDDSTRTQSDPRWSPDGTRVLFLSEGGVFSAPAFGGPARPEVPARPERPVVSAAWSPDGRRLAYAVPDTLYLREEGGTTRALAELREAGLCSWSPDGSRIACASGNLEYARPGQLFGNLSPSVIAVVRVRDGAVGFATDRVSLNQSPVWGDDTHLYFVSARRGLRDIYAVELTADGTAAGAPTRLSVGLNAHTISISAGGGRIAYSSFAAASNIWRLPIPSSPPVSAYTGTQVTHGNQLIEGIALSHDGQWIYYDSDLAGNGDLYRVPAAGGPPERLTTDPSDDFSPTPSPDGREVAFHSWRTGNRDLFVMPLDGRPLEQVTATPRHEVVPKWSPDGRALIYTEFVIDSAARGAAWVSRRGTDGRWQAPERLVDWGSWPSWASDGRRLAYTHGFRSASLFVRDSATGPERLLHDAVRDAGPQVEEFVWSEDGRTIYFKSHSATGEAAIWSIPASGGRPQLLVRFDDLTRPSARFRLGVGSGHFYVGIEEQRSDVAVMDLERGERR